MGPYDVFPGSAMIRRWSKKNACSRCGTLFSHALTVSSSVRGPGNPTDFQVPATMKALEKRKIPAFGVCLGLQGMVEHYGGKLDVSALFDLLRMEYWM